MRTLLLFFTACVIVFFGWSCDSSSGPAGETGIQFTLLDDDARTVPSGELISFRIAVKNGNATIASVECVRTDSDLPDTTWVSSLCAAGRCFPAIVDSVSADIEAGRTEEYSLDILAGSKPGTGRVTIRMYNLNDPTERYEHTFSCTVAP